VTGTGKTISVNSMLLCGFSPQDYVSMLFAFSAQTTANQTQDIIDGRLDKRRKGQYGAPINKKMIIFVDDLSMPAKEKYGCQPPIEILRQVMSQDGWYDRKTWDFKQLVDLLFLGAMAPPGGGRNDITDRYTRYFNLLYVTPFDEDSLSRVFGTIMNKVRS
jgi:dynein heavy chain, axonemal